MNISKRIYFNSGVTTNIINDKFIQIKLEQNVKTIEVLSMKIGTEDIYQNLNSDYGVLVGRVIANGGVGIPNAKISIFIPLDDDDINDSEIYSVYPYKSPRDKNLEGKRYNLLPRVSQFDFSTKTFKPRQPFGSMFIEPELMVNDIFMKVYKKYYKYTAITNKSGDYMIFGVPVGTHTVHMSVDITDIGEYSMNPASMVTNLGYSPNLFTDNNTRIKESNDIDDLPHIETQEISVDIRPFWGDKNNFEIGITRQDFRIRANIASQFTIFGSVFTDGENSRWCDNYEGKDDNGDSFSKFSYAQLYKTNNNDQYDRYADIKIKNKRIGIISEKIYYYPNTVSDEEIEQNGVDLYQKMKLLNPAEYSVYKRDGDFVFIINCNRKKVIINDLGERVEVPESYNGGIYTEFKGFIILEYTEDSIPVPFKKINDEIAHNTRSVTQFRTRIKIPQSANPKQGLESSSTAHQWRNQHYTFSANTIYSVARFNATVYNKINHIYVRDKDEDGFTDIDSVNNLYNEDRCFMVGVIQTDGEDNEPYEFPSNGADKSGTKLFGGNWLNFSIYLPQLGYVVSDEFDGMRVNTYFHIPQEKNRLTDNNDPIAANDTNTKWFPRTDLNWTNFIVVPENEIKIFRGFPKKGGDNDDNYFKNITNIINKSNYMYGEKDCPYGGGKKDGNSSNSTKDSKVYFYKGFDTADCIDFVSRVLNIQ